jgi:hypothetical protein
MAMSVALLLPVFQFLQPFEIQDPQTLVFGQKTQIELLFERSL